MKYKKIIISLLALSILCRPILPAMAESATLKKIQTNSDIETSIAVAKELNSQSNTYVIATTLDYPDALAGTVLASKFNAPILFASLSDNRIIFDYLETRNVDEMTQFYILGGEAVVSSALESYLKSISSKVVRLGGWTKYDTANLINDYLNTTVGSPVIVTTGRIYPDALSMGAIGGQLQYPIYIVDENSISENAVQQLQRIKPLTVYIAGGTFIIPPIIENQIRILLPSANIVRLAGYDKYETSSKIADYFSSYLKETIYTTGEDFHSALVAAPLAAKHKASITLVDNITTEYQAMMNQQFGYVIGDLKVLLSPMSPAAVQLLAEKQSMLGLINQERSKAGVSTLNFDEKLQIMAQAKSDDMVAKSYFAHNSPTYGSPFEMMKTFGIGYQSAGENLAGNISVQAAHLALMDSPGHKANILRSSFNDVGIGITIGPHGIIISQEFTN